MSTEFFAMQAPPGKAALASYDRSKHFDEQSESIPSNFLEAMAVREEVFVHEQHVPLENELDDDDHRSWHWITFVSVGATASSTSATNSQSAKRGSTAARKAAATIRLVPPPHEAHALAPGADKPVYTQDGHGPNSEDEPYVKLGRLSTLKPYRGLGLARMLVDNVLRWASEHPEDIMPPPSATDREAARLEVQEEEREATSREWDSKRWQGLVLVHSQAAVQGWWEKCGFHRDASLGEWDEEGIKHVGLWQRIPVRQRRPSMHAGLSV